MKKIWQRLHQSDKGHENHNSAPAIEPSSNKNEMNWPSNELVMSNGVAIFHLATSRVAVCYDTMQHFWFLPKGRRDEGEEGRIAAEREGWEESGYRNRLLPLPVRHRQPRAHTSVEGRPTNVIEPVLTELMPLMKNVMYLLHWYVAETLPEVLEKELDEQMQQRGNSSVQRPYIIPPAYPGDLSFKQRTELDYSKGLVYEPFRHEKTGVDEVEIHYISQLMSVDEACEKLSSKSERKVVRLAWEYIQERWKSEGGSAPDSSASETWSNVTASRLN